MGRMNDLKRFRALRADLEAVESGVYHVTPEEYKKMLDLYDYLEDVVSDI